MPQISDSAKFQQNIKHLILENYTEDEIKNPMPEIENGILKLIAKYISEICLIKPVWFKIEKYLFGYYIPIYYDNRYNQANEEDL